MDLIPSTGTTYSGVIEDYHDVQGFILAQRPASIRVIGQAPVVAKIFNGSVMLATVSGIVLRDALVGAVD